jgi:outer membrane protein assembly factor BamD
MQTIKKLKLAIKYLFPCIVLFLVFSCKTALKEPSFEPEASLEKANELIKTGYYEDAREILEEIKAKDASQKYATIAKLRIADSYLDDELYEEAAVEYESFLNIHPYHKYSPYAQYKLAVTYFRRIKTVDVSSSWAQKALEEFEKLQRKYPRNPYMDITDSRIQACKRILAEYQFYVGKFYFKKGSYKAASGRFNDLLETYPDSKKEPEALFFLGLSYKNMGEEGKAKSALSLLIEKFPTIKLSNEAREHISHLTVNSSK